MHCGKSKKLCCQSQGDSVAYKEKLTWKMIPLGEEDFKEDLSVKWTLTTMHTRIEQPLGRGSTVSLPLVTRVNSVGATGSE